VGVYLYLLAVHDPIWQVTLRTCAMGFR